MRRGAVEWIQCSEQLPSPNTWVLGWRPVAAAHPQLHTSPSAGVVLVARSPAIIGAQWNWEATDDCYDSGEITHWMPLPDGPA